MKTYPQDGPAKAKRRAALRMFVQGAIGDPKLTSSEANFVATLQRYIVSDSGPLPSRKKYDIIEAISEKLALDDLRIARKRATLRTFLQFATEDPALTIAEIRFLRSLQCFVTCVSGPLPSVEQYQVLEQIRRKLLSEFVILALGDPALTAYEANFVNSIKMMVQGSSGPMPSEKQWAILIEIRDKLSRIAAAPDPDDQDDDADPAVIWSQLTEWERQARLKVEWTDEFSIEGAGD